MTEIESINDLNKILRGNGKVLALFYASWCPFCRSFLKVFEKYDGTWGSTKILRVKLDSEDNPIWAEFNIEVVPTVILFNGEKVEARLDGTLGKGLSEEQLKNFFKHKNFEYKAQADS
jgi:thioredoxin 1